MGTLTAGCPYARLSSVPGTRALRRTEQLLCGALSAPDALLGTALVSSANRNPRRQETADFGFAKWGDEALR